MRTNGKCNNSHTKRYSACRQNLIFMKEQNMNKISTQYRCTGRSFTNSPQRQGQLLRSLNNLEIGSISNRDYLQYKPTAHSRLLKHVIKYCKEVYERLDKNLFWSIKNLGEVLDKLKARDFNATYLSTYDCSTLNTTLPHNLITDKLIGLIESTYNRECSPLTLHVRTETLCYFGKA